MAHMKQLCEHEGVLLEIEYSEPSHAEGVKIDSARVLDEKYRATGPNLVPLLDKMFFLTQPGEGTMFFSRVADDLTT
jgi:hypothetical protein